MLWDTFQSSFQLLENWEVCFNKHKIQLCMVRDVDNLILCGQGEHYCPVMFLAGMGDKPLPFLKRILFQTNLL